VAWGVDLLRSFTADLNLICEIRAGTVTSVARRARIANRRRSSSIHFGTAASQPGAPPGFATHDGLDLPLERSVHAEARPRPALNLQAAEALADIAGGLGAVTAPTGAEHAKEGTMKNAKPAAKAKTARIGKQSRSAADKGAAQRQTPQPARAARRRSDPHPSRPYRGRYPGHRSRPRSLRCCADPKG
jgi:hypothetical protein